MQLVFFLGGGWGKLGWIYIYIGEVSEAVTMTKSRGGGGRKGARGGRNTFGNGVHKHYTLSLKTSMTLDDRRLVDRTLRNRKLDDGMSNQMLLDDGIANEMTLNIKPACCAG